MDNTSQQPLELHCQAIVHLAPGTFEIRGGVKSCLSTHYNPLKPLSRWLNLPD